MRTPTLILVAAFLGLAPGLRANQRIACAARVALNRVYMASVDETTREMRVTSDVGAVWEGVASFYRSSTGRIRTYYIPLYEPYGMTNYYPTGMALDIDSGTKEMALCLRTSECYICQ